MRTEFEKHFKADTDDSYNAVKNEYLVPELQAQWEGYCLGFTDKAAHLRVLTVQQSRITILEGFVHFVLDGLRHKHIKAKPFINEARQMESLESYARKILL
jgi:hypothetical protein